MRVRLFLFTLFRIPEKEKRRKKAAVKRRRREKKARDETPPQAADETAREPESGPAGKEMIPDGAGSSDENATVQEQTKTQAGTGALEEAAAGPEKVTATDISDTEPSPDGQKRTGGFWLIWQDPAENPPSVRQNKSILGEIKDRLPKYPVHNPAYV